MGPWKMIEMFGPGAQGELDYVVYLCAESIRVASILLQPFMPEKMKRGLDMLGVDESKRTFDHARFGTDFTYGTPFFDIGKAGPTGTLFPPLIAER